MPIDDRAQGIFNRIRIDFSGDPKRHGLVESRVRLVAHLGRRDDFPLRLRAGRNPGYLAVAERVELYSGILHCLNPDSLCDQPPAI